MGMGVLVPVDTSTGIKVRTHCFSEKFRKGFSFWYSYFFWKDLSWQKLVVSKFFWEGPKFKENVLICAITVTKVHDVLLTLLQVKTILPA